MTQIKLVVFDLDGTLINTIDDLGMSTNEALKQHGYPTHPIESYKTFVGNGIQKLIERAMPEGMEDEVLIYKVKDTMVTYYDAHLTDFSVLYEGVEALIKELKERKIRMAIVTNKPHVQAIKLVQSCFGEDTFCTVLGNKAEIPHKPDPYGVQLLLKEVGVSHQEVLYVGDSDVDMQTALNAQIYGIGVSWGFRSEEELRANGAKAVIHTPLELIQYLEMG